MIKFWLPLATRPLMDVRPVIALVRLVVVPQWITISSILAGSPFALFNFAWLASVRNVFFTAWLSGILRAIFAAALLAVLRAFAVCTNYSVEEYALCGHPEIGGAVKMNTV